MSKLRIGVVNWERTGSNDSYFGYHISKSLSPSKYRDRTPYYADVISEDQIAFHITTQEEYDKELQYAIDAGIDYFAYTWNTDEKSNRIDLPEATPEQIECQLNEEDNTKRKLHTKSILKSKIKLCAILLCMHKFSDNDMKKLIDEMKEDYYEKIENRPLVYLFGGYRTDYIERLQKAAEENGVPKPYIIFVDNGAVSENGDYSMADAVSGYSYADYEIYKKGFLYSEFCKSLIARNEKRKKFCVDIIPLFSAGWNPMPRLDNPVPWFQDYQETACVYSPTNQELKDGADMFCQWMKENTSYMKSMHTLTFAWNEFEEGAWLCPTYADDLSIDDSRIETFSEIVKKWKSELG